MFCFGTKGPQYCRHGRPVRNRTPNSRRDAPCNGALRAARLVPRSTNRPTPSRESFFCPGRSNQPAANTHPPCCGQKEKKVHTAASGLPAAAPMKPDLGPRIQPRWRWRPSRCPGAVPVCGAAIKFACQPFSRMIVPSDRAGADDVCDGACPAIGRRKSPRLSRHERVPRPLHFANQFRSWPGNRAIRWTGSKAPSARPKSPTSACRWNVWRFFHSLIHGTPLADVFSRMRQAASAEGLGPSGPGGCSARLRRDH